MFVKAPFTIIRGGSMPVDPARFDGIADAVAAVYDEAELALLRLITARLARDLDAADWQQRRLAEVGQLQSAARAIVARLNTAGPGAVRDAMAAAWRAGNDAALTDLARTAAVPGKHPQAVQALTDAILGELRPLHAQILPSAGSAYRNAIAAATSRKLTGVQSTRRAAQAAWTALVDDGITSFTDVRGRNWRLHTYVEMAVRTGVTRSISIAVEDACRAAGNPFVYVTDRQQECAVCRPWEHRVLTIDLPVTAPAYATVAAARRSGLHHPNCRHDLAPYLLGRTRLAPGRPDPEGDVARQRQRYLERQLRHWREREATALYDEPARLAASRVLTYDAELTAHLAATGLTRLVHREHPGAGYAARESRQGDPARLTAGP
jgi:hypothetical protein